MSAQPAMTSRCRGRCRPCDWNRAKHQAAPWWADNSKEAYSSGLDGLARALKNWSDSRNGRRKGCPVGFPRFKRRGRRDACQFTTGAIRVLGDRTQVAASGRPADGLRWWRRGPLASAATGSTS